MNISDAKSATRIASFKLKPLGVLPVIAVTFPAAWIFGLVWRYGENVPFWDEWSLLPFFEKAHAHTLSFADFLVQNNEHRLAFPKIIFLALEQFGGWNPRAEMFVSLVLCTFTALCLQWLLVRTASLAGFSLLLATFVMTLLLFSPCQYENWLWGYQLSCFLLDVCFVAGIAILCSRCTKVTKLIGAGGCAFVATFSGAGGIVAWPILLLLFLVIAPNPVSGTSIYWSLAWLIVAAVAIAIYYHGYQRPIWHPPLAASHNVLDYVCYFLAFVGSPLGRYGPTRSLAAPILVGSFELLALGFYLVRLAGNRRLISAAAPWLALSSYALLTDGLACLARIGFGRTQALESRYTTFALFLPISLVALGFLLESQVKRRTVFYRTISVALLVAGLVVFCQTIPFALKMVTMAGRSRAAGHAALAFINCIPQKNVLTTSIHPNFELLVNYSGRANALHLLRPPLFEPFQLKHLLTSTREDSDTCGSLKSLRIGPRMYSAQTATAQNSRRAPDALVFCYRGTDNRVVPFAVALEHSDIPRLSYQSGNEAARSWTGGLDEEWAKIPPNADIEAWGFHTRGGALCELAGVATRSSP